MVLVFSIPSVQTRLGSYATNSINETYGTAIKIEKVGLQFNGDVELKNILIRDHYDAVLISASELNTSILSFVKLAENKEDYVIRIQELLNEKYSDNNKERILFARSHTWENSIKAIWDAVTNKNSLIQNISS